MRTLRFAISLQPTPAIAKHEHPYTHQNEMMWRRSTLQTQAVENPHAIALGLLNFTKKKFLTFSPESLYNGHS
jgi:hypothetical protein